MKRAAKLTPGALVGTVAVALLASGCAGRSRPRSDYRPLPPAAESRRETAPPAARDALAAGLEWIAADAPATRVGPPAGGGEKP